MGAAQCAGKSNAKDKGKFVLQEGPTTRSANKVIL